MTKTTAGPSRLESQEEAALRVWFEEQEKKSIDNLEAGARQIISLVTAFYSLIFGVLALGADKLEASLHYRWVIIPAMIAVLAMLGAVLAALLVVLPIFSYTYNPNKPAGQKKTFETMSRLKSTGLRLSVIAFGLGLLAFAWLIIMMLYNR